MNSEQYIWHTVGDDDVRSAHAARAGKIFSWTNPPEGGHPGEDYNCRCWAEPVSKKPPIPKRKPNCRKEQAAYQETKQNLENLEDRKEKLLEDLQKLRETLKEIGERMTEVLGINIATFIITLPIHRLSFLAELLRRYFGNIISNELLEAADQLAKERSALIQKAEHKMDQLKIVMAQLKPAEQKFEQAKQTLDECQTKIPGK